MINTNSACNLQLQLQLIILHAKLDKEHAHTTLYFFKKKTFAQNCFAREIIPLVIQSDTLDSAWMAQSFTLMKPIEGWKEKIC